MTHGADPITLVTGGAGFIGSHLAEELARRGRRVRVLDDFSSGSEANLAAVQDMIEVVRGDVRDLACVKRAAEGASTVFHLAGLASVPLSQEDPRLCLDVNGAGTLNVFSAAAAAGARRLVYASTSAVYGDLAPPHAESLLPSPNTPYAAVKLLGEHLGLFFESHHGLRSVSLRYFNVYGPRQTPDGPDSGVIPLFVEAARRGERPVIYGDGSQTRDFVHVEDVVRATVLAAESPDASGCYNVATGRPVSISELARLLGSLRPGAFPAPGFAPSRSGDPPESWADAAKAERELGFRASFPLREGLEGLLEGSGL
ncbi:MAG: NAD-dependent epimerase/dehydratase family protein [Deltaproteobacteria bacterium]|jgi:nucleoside-diphosphate-sugar epimerase|nr:NAD-dependent epimerase/dehydratase family protein [Deltaproteobacteria bacterium]